ncbi:MAG: hypothetical protein IKG23_00550 [Clostridia bacterium]|nr:hypothetical protein [Clostridia bacterium]
MDREKVIKGLEILMNGCEYIHCEDCCFYISTKPTRCGLREEQIQEDALALLKEQEEREQRICKSICNFIRGACSTDTDDDKDFVCYEIQKCFTEGR